MARRHVEESIFKVLMVTSALTLAASLAFILVSILVKGLPALNLGMLISAPKGGYYLGKEGGILNAILGSLAIGFGSTALALALSLPLVLYLNIYLKRRSKLALAVRFFLDVLWGIPSIVYGAFGFTVMMAIGMRASLLAGTVTLSLVILPIMARSMDEVLKMIPFGLKETSSAMGSTRLETAFKVVLKQAYPGVLAAVLTAFGRGIGDAAAVLFTASYTDFLPYSLFKPVATLPLAIFFQLATPFPEVQQRGYASALVLTVLILAISLTARWLGRRFTQHVIR